MLFVEGPQIKNIAADLNKLFRQGSLLNQSGQTVEGDSTADQGTSDLLAARDPVIQEISVGMSGEQSARYTVSGTPPLSLPNSLGKPLKAWSVDVLPYQEGTGDPSPSNVRPIHGTDKLNVFVEESYDQSATPKAVIDMPAQGKNILNIDASNHNAWAFVNIPNNLQPNTEYTFSINGTTSYSYALYLGNYNQSTRALTQSITSGESFTFTTPSSMSGEPLLAVAGSVSGAGNESLSNILPQVELGDTKTPYEPFTNTLYTGTIGSEGGESRDAMADMGTLSWARYTNVDHPVYYARLTNAKPNVWPVMCSGYTPTFWHQLQDLPDCNIQIHPTLNIAYIRDDRYETAEAFTAGVDGVQLLYQLDPTTDFAVPSVTIPTPTGTATTWATAEDGTVESMSVTYVGKA